jgi:hypothetical protein
VPQQLSTLRTVVSLLLCDYCSVVFLALQAMQRERITLSLKRFIYVCNRGSAPSIVYYQQSVQRVHRACSWGNLERNVRSPRISAVFAPQQNPTLSDCVHNQRLKNVDAIQVCCREEQHTQHVRSTVR